MAIFNFTNYEFDLTRCAKGQKYEQGKIGLQVFYMCTNNVVEHFEKKLKSCTGVLLRADLKVALSQKRLEDFYFTKINIPNHYPEQEI